jgi:hypothetical protein
MIGSALSRSEAALTTKIASRIPVETIERMLTLIARRTASPDKAPDGKDSPEGATARWLHTSRGKRGTRTSSRALTSSPRSARSRATSA